MNNEQLREQLKQWAIYSPGEIKDVPVKDLLTNFELEPIGKGYNARVSRLKGLDWVVKEGKWDVKIDLAGMKQIPIPTAAVKKVMDMMSFTFFPDAEEVLRQYKIYLNFVEYLGYFRTNKGILGKNEIDYYHPNLDLIISAQKNIRSSLVFYIDQLENYYNFKFAKRDLLERVLTSKAAKYNFLPEEYLLYGDSMSPENKGKKTYFIFQKFIPGTTIHDVEVAEMGRDVKEQLVVLVFLLLLINYQHHYFPDTRPRKTQETYYWLTKTDNIVVTKKGVKFIDTRWFWETRSMNLAKRGLFIPEIAINMSKRTINGLLNNI